MTITKQSISSQPTLLKTGAVASLLHVSEQTVRDWTDKGILRGQVSDTGHRLYSELDVEKTRLEVQGTVGFWHTEVAISVDSNFSAKLQSFPDEEDRAIAEFKDFNAWWDFSNSLGDLARKVVRNKTADSSFDMEALQWSDEQGSYITFFLYVAALDKELLQGRIKELLSEAEDHVRDICVPVQKTVWVFKENNTEVNYM